MLGTNHYLKYIWNSIFQELTIVILRWFVIIILADYYEFFYSNVCGKFWDQSRDLLNIGVLPHEILCTSNTRNAVGNVQHKNGRILQIITISMYSPSILTGATTENQQIHGEQSSLKQIITLLLLNPKIHYCPIKRPWLDPFNHFNIILWFESRSQYRPFRFVPRLKFCSNLLPSPCVLSA